MPQRTLSTPLEHRAAQREEFACTRTLSLPAHCSDSRLQKLLQKTTDGLQLCARETERSYIKLSHLNSARMMKFGTYVRARTYASSCKTSWQPIAILQQ